MHYMLQFSQINTQGIFLSVKNNPFVFNLSEFGLRPHSDLYLSILVTNSDLKWIIHSYSVYFIEAIDVYARKYNKRDKVDYFYITEKNDLIKVEDNELNIIYTHLNEPLDILEQLEMETLYH